MSKVSLTVQSVDLCTNRARVSFQSTNQRRATRTKHTQLVVGADGAIKSFMKIKTTAIGQQESVATSNDRHLAQSSLSDFRREAWVAHNQTRGKHGAPYLVLADDLNSLAQQWAEKMAKIGKIEANKNCLYGQNIYYARNKALTGADPVTKWYNTAENYDFYNPTYSKETGGLTQLLWLSSSRLGVGFAQTQAAELYVVCYYDPPGNIQNLFKENVRPPLLWTPRVSFEQDGYKTPYSELSENGAAGGQEENASFDKERVIKQVLDAHNDYRQLHGVQRLILSGILNDFAQDWADKLANRKQLEHRANNKYGENLFYSFNKGYDGADAAKSWYSEIDAYDFGSPDFTENTGHFTQLVWKNSKFIGVGVACPRPGEIYVVCNYDPPGNVLGQFEENVTVAGKQ